MNLMFIAYCVKLAFSIVIDTIPCNISTTAFTHNYLMQAFPSKRYLNTNINNDIYTTRYV